MPRSIVICCDGTGNEIDDNHSNVLKLYRTLEKSEEQITYYDPGLGTLGAQSDWGRIKQNVEKIAGLALGYGLDRNVLDAYRFLVTHYEKGDAIYLFGFSRGAYTVRVLAGFINAMGLLNPDQVNLAGYAFVTYKQLDESSDYTGVRLFERSLRPLHPPIAFLGLWDTVSSIIVPRSDRFFIPSLRQLAFTANNPSVECVRHALAIDERRRMFRPFLWAEGELYWGNPFKTGEPTPQDVKQVWFAGVHSDVGGGYREEQSGLAKLALNWMIEESPTALKYVTTTVKQVAKGIPRANSTIEYAKPDPLAEQHQSLTLGWQPLEYLPKRCRLSVWPERNASSGWYVPRGEARYIAPASVIHPSVRERVVGGVAYSPENLPD